jgi:hypothetical protein
VPEEVSERYPGVDQRTGARVPAARSCDGRCVALGTRRPVPERTARRSSNPEIATRRSSVAGTWRPSPPVVMSRLAEPGSSNYRGLLETLAHVVSCGFPTEK